MVDNKCRFTYLYVCTRDFSFTYFFKFFRKGNLKPHKIL